ncbi:conserved hypothetical protein, partial [Mycobacterium tuberculosis T92]
GRRRRHRAPDRSSSTSPGLDFMGCCAFAALADEAQRCRCRGIDLRLVSHQPIVARIAEAGGLSRVLPIYPTVDTALGKGTAGPARC